MQRDGAEIRQAGLRADRGIFRDLDGDFVALVLVRECFDVRQWNGNTALCMVLVIAMLCGLRFSFCRFTFHVSRRLDLFHPLHLADFLQLNVEGDPGANHIGIYLTRAPFSNASAGAMAHELRALGFERIVGNWGAFMDPTGVLSTFVFSGDDHAC